jgi:hypothetical protein
MGIENAAPRDTTVTVSSLALHANTVAGALCADLSAEAIRWKAIRALTQSTTLAVEDSPTVDAAMTTGSFALAADLIASNVCC